MTTPTDPALPLIDEHSVRVQAGLDTTWRALLYVMERSREDRARARIASLLGCEPAVSDGVSLSTTGATLPGFRVTAADPPRRLDLAGRHRFSDYALVYHLEELPNGEVCLKAETRAEFPGPWGRIYRTLVIGTRGHVLVVTRLLAAVRRRAVRSASPDPA